MYTRFGTRTYYTRSGVRCHAPLGHSGGLSEVRRYMTLLYGAGSVGVLGRTTELLEIYRVEAEPLLGGVLYGGEPGQGLQKLV